MTHPDDNPRDPHSSAIALSDEAGKEGPITTAELAVGLQEIARATDAIVRRVTEGGGIRDQSEHVLDQARREGREETLDGRQHNVRCDRCGLKSPGASTQARANLLAEHSGWSVNDKYDHCPTCRSDSPKQLGPGAVTGDDQLPVEPSISDTIFLTRVEWIFDRFASGATSVATILNARRSGHRSMLTDLARSFGYDESAFFAKLRTMTESVMTAVPEDSALWNFVRKLFRLLKAEDDA